MRPPETGIHLALCGADVFFSSAIGYSTINGYVERFLSEMSSSLNRNSLESLSARIIPTPHNDVRERNAPDIDATAEPHFTNRIGALSPWVKDYFKAACKFETEWASYN